MLLDTLVLPKDGLAALVFAVVMLQILEFATRKSAALARVEVEEVFAPSVVVGLDTKLEFRKIVSPSLLIT